MFAARRGERPQRKKKSKRESLSAQEGKGAVPPGRYFLAPGNIASLLFGKAGPPGPCGKGGEDNVVRGKIHSGPRKSAFLGKLRGSCHRDGGNPAPEPPLPTDLLIEPLKEKTRTLRLEKFSYFYLLPLRVL
ncbi:hypothetical protein [Thermosulfurimonas marina]|uniref:hypothetical protein n=1 Tax=Thermosulfurimonas marina TaxID=2047767 RepID=UPI00144AE067|nr:hypothetical protein [Thermosulfurimonas marina]